MHKEMFCTCLRWRHQRLKMSQWRALARITFPTSNSFKSDAVSPVNCTTVLCNNAPKRDVHEAKTASTMSYLEIVSTTNNNRKCSKQQQHHFSPLLLQCNVHTFCIWIDRKQTKHCKFSTYSLPEPVSQSEIKSTHCHCLHTMQKMSEFGLDWI